MNWHEYFNYKEGKLYWKIFRKNGTPAGSLAGTTVTPNGYNRVRVCRKDYMVHRIIYEMFHGKLTDKQQIDHINGDRLDNRIENLRVCTSAENHKNRKIPENNSIQVKGVCFRKNKKKRPYQALIWIEGKSKHLGYFDTAEEASAAYNARAKELHGEFYRDTRTTS